MNYTQDAVILQSYVHQIHFQHDVTAWVAMYIPAQLRTCMCLLFVTEFTKIDQIVTRTDIQIKA